MLMDDRSIGIFDQYIGMACAKGRLRCSLISLVLIYLITMWEWHVPKLDLDVHAFYLY